MEFASLAPPHFNRNTGLSDFVEEKLNFDLPLKSKSPPPPLPLFISNQHESKSPTILECNILIVSTHPQTNLFMNHIFTPDYFTLIGAFVNPYSNPNYQAPLSLNNKFNLNNNQSSLSNNSNNVNVYKSKCGSYILLVQDNSIYSNTNYNNNSLSDIHSNNFGMAKQIINKIKFKLICALDIVYKPPLNIKYDINLHYQRYNNNNSNNTNTNNNNKNNNNNSLKGPWLLESSVSRSEVLLNGEGEGEYEGLSVYPCPNMVFGLMSSLLLECEVQNRPMKNFIIFYSKDFIVEALFTFSYLLKMKYNHLPLLPFDKRWEGFAEDKEKQNLLFKLMKDQAQSLNLFDLPLLPSDSDGYNNQTEKETIAGAAASASTRNRTNNHIRTQDLFV